MASFFDLLNESQFDRLAETMVPTADHVAHMSDIMEQSVSQRMEAIQHSSQLAENMTPTADQFSHMASSVGRLEVSINNFDQMYDSIFPTANQINHMNNITKKLISQRMEAIHHSRQLADDMTLTADQANRMSNIVERSVNRRMEAMTELNPVIEVMTTTSFPIIEISIPDSDDMYTFDSTKYDRRSTYDESTYSDIVQFQVQIFTKYVIDSALSDEEYVLSSSHLIIANTLINIAVAHSSDYAVLSALISGMINLSVLERSD